MFANDASFSNWQSWVNDSNNKASVTTNMVENAKMFSGYALKIYCNLDGLTHVFPAQNPTAEFRSGCCMGDSVNMGQEANMGGFCIIMKGAIANVAKTYRLSSAQFKSLATLYTLDEAAAVSVGSNYDINFELFNCSGELY